MIRAKSNLKEILDERGITIRQFEAMSNGRLKYETLRRLYHDETKQYQRDTIGIICELLDIEISDLLKLTDEPE